MYAKIPCKRCLVKDMQDDALRKTVDDYISSLKEDEKTSKSQAESRMNICKDCKWLSYGTCTKSGRLVDAAAFCRLLSCPLDFWKKC